MPQMPEILKTENLKWIQQFCGQTIAFLAIASVMPPGILAKMESKPYFLIKLDVSLFSFSFFINILQFFASRC